jgi:hypothetical protein
MKIWAVVPVKALRLSKQRLSAALGPRRENFSRALLVQTLTALAASRRVTGILVVTADPEVADEARQAGAEVLQKDADLNTACADGMRALADSLGRALARRTTLYAPANVSSPGKYPPVPVPGSGSGRQAAARGARTARMERAGR